MADFGVRALGIGCAVWLMLRHKRGGMIVMRGRRIFAWMTLAGADKRDGAGNDCAEERQEDDRFVHFKNRAVQLNAAARRAFLAGARPVPKTGTHFSGSCASPSSNSRPQPRSSRGCGNRRPKSQAR